MEPLSVAITFFNSSRYLLPAILEPLNSELVTEIVIVNDCSSTEETINLKKVIESLEKGSKVVFENPSGEKGKRTFLLRKFADILKLDFRKNERYREVKVTGDPKKIRVINLDRNVGAYRAKHYAISEAKNDFVLLLDGDNFLLESTINNLAVEQKSYTEILCPNVQVMNHNYLDIWDARNFRRLGFDSLDFKKLIGAHPELVMGTDLGKFLNTGNFLVPRISYLEISSKVQTLSPVAGAQDAMLLTIAWLLNGYSLRIVPGFHYFHRIHERSFWRTDNTPRLELQELVSAIREIPGFQKH